MRLVRKMKIDVLRKIDSILFNSALDMIGYI